MGFDQTTCSMPGSNRRPSAHKTDALPTELIEQKKMLVVGLELTLRTSTNLDKQETVLRGIQHVLVVDSNQY